MARTLTPHLETHVDPGYLPSVLKLGSWSAPLGVSIFVLNLAGATLFLLLGPYSNFASAGFLDPWFYTGYFTHFAYMVSHFGATYYVSRLPWIIPGILAFKIAPPMAASVLLNALITASSATALFFIVYWSYGPWPGALACVALITNPYFMSTVSWDYPDGPAIAYGFIALALLLRPGTAHFPSNAYAGFAFACCASTNLAAIPVLLGILMVPIWRYKRNPGDLVRTVGAFLCGVLAAVIVFTVLNRWLLNTDQFYLLPQIKMIQYVRDHPDYLPRMWGTGNAWIPQAYRLAPAGLTLLAGAAVLSRRNTWKGAFLPVYICWFTTFGLLCLFEFQFHSVSLRVGYVGSYMICPLMACAGLLIGQCLSPSGLAKPSQLMYWLVGALVAVGLALPIYYPHSAPHLISNSGFWIVFGVLSGVAALLIAANLRSRIIGAVACCFILLGLFIGPAHDQGPGYIWSKDNAAVFQTLMQIENTVDSRVPVSRRVRFWFDHRQPASSLFDSASSLYLWDYFDFADKLRSAPASEIGTAVNANMTIAHLTLAPAETADWTRLLASRGIVVGNERSAVVPSSLGDIHVVLQDILDTSNLR